MTAAEAMPNNGWVYPVAVFAVLILVAAAIYVVLRMAKDGSKTRWRIARWLDDDTDRCWADLVTWALGWHGIDGINHEARCVQSSIDDGRCYCGKYENGCERVPINREVSHG